MSGLEPASGGMPLGDDGLYEAAARLIDQARTTIAYHANVVSVVFTLAGEAARVMTSHGRNRTRWPAMNET